MFCIVGNLARGKPAIQSSTRHGGIASKAVDGNKNMDFHAGSCTHTRIERRPWWRVDLESYYKVKGVRLTNRGDCCSERLRQIEIIVGDVDRDPTIGSNHLCVD